MKDFRYRNAITKIRSSSHPLEIERGRYTKPKTPRSNRLCFKCKLIEDERHFVMNCILYEEERCMFFYKVTRKEPMFSAMSTEEKFISLMSSKDAQILTWLGKFLFQIFRKRNEYFKWTKRFLLIFLYDIFLSFHVFLSFIPIWNIFIICMFTHVLTSVCVCACECMSVDVCVYVSVHAHVCVSVCEYVSVYI